MSDITPLDIQMAFIEGFEMGIDHNNIAYKYPPVGIAWLQSQARQSWVGGGMTNEQADAVMKWYAVKAYNGERTDSPMEKLV